MFRSVDVELIFNNNILKKYHYNGEIFVESPDRGNYSLRLTNHSSKKKLAVISIDGRSIVSGELADYNCPGYILIPYQSIEIKGWLRTNTECASFEFSKKENSYDLKIGGDGKNLGVIGVAIFDEIKPITIFNKKTIYNLPSRDSKYYKSYNYNSSMTADSLEPSHNINIENSILNNAELSTSSMPSNFISDLGTGYGSKISTNTEESYFNRKNYPNEIISLRYATKDTLKKWGVIKENNKDSKPNPFPNQKIYVKAPSDWIG